MADDKPEPPKYNPLRIKALIHAILVQKAYLLYPNSDLVTELGQQLKFSDEEIAAAEQRVRRAETESLNLRTAAEQDRAIMRDLRAENERLRTEAAAPRRPGPKKKTPPAETPA